MARARPSELSRARSKPVAIEELTQGIEKLQGFLAEVTDLAREGFPYRDAARARTELQIRECVRQIFGDKSPEYQTYRAHKLDVTTPAGTERTLALIKSFIVNLQDKKLEMQGIKPPSPPNETYLSGGTPVQTSPTPPVPAIKNTARVPVPPPGPATTPPVTISVSLASNLASPPPQPPAPVPAPAASAAPTMAGARPASHGRQASTSPAVHTPGSPASPTAVSRSEPPAVSKPVSAPVPPVETPHGPAEEATPAPLPHRTTAPGHAKGRTEPFPVIPLPRTPPPPVTSTERQPSIDTPDPTTSQPAVPEQDGTALSQLRKVCSRFHSAARQLRLRKEYRETLEIEDERDVHDLLCALLRVQFDEIGTDEWPPSRAGGDVRPVLLLDRNRIAVTVTKTRSGVAAREITDQLRKDASYSAAQTECTTLFCFVYDPDGRIGNPRSLELEFAGNGGGCAVEVFVNPK